MSRCIQESNLLSVDLNHIGANMLSDASRFAVSHIGMTDRIQKRGLSVIDMTHDADDRGTLHHQVFVFLILF